MKFSTGMAWLAALAVSACGGGGGGGGGSPPAAPPVPPQAEVSIAGTGPSEAVPAGTTTQMNVTIRNSGQGTATTLLFAPRLSDKSDQLAMTCTAAGGAVCPAVSGIAPAGASYSIPSLPPGGELVFKIDVGIVSNYSGSIVHSPTVTAVNDATAGNNAASVSMTVYSANLNVTGSGPTAPVTPGNAATYAMTVRNAGPDAARNVAIMNYADAGQSVTSMNCSAGGGAVCPSVLGAAMTVSALPFGGSLAFTVVTSVPPGTSGAISDQMSAKAAGDPNLNDNYGGAAVQASFSAPASSNEVTLSSDTGDYIGQGKSYEYAQVNSSLSVVAVGGRLTVQIKGDTEQWTGDFVLPSALSQFQPGTYANLGRPPFNNPLVGGMNWTGNGRGCNIVLGTFVVDSVRYAGGQLSAIDLGFEQHCEGNAVALRGRIRWAAGDTGQPVGPSNPPPPDLWAPAPGATPNAGSYVHLTSDPDDYLARGATTTYTQANSALSVTVVDGHVAVRILGDQTWSGDFQPMGNVSQLPLGYYRGLHDYPFQNPARGGLTWYGEGRGCAATGWFVVDGVTYANGAVATLDLRFEHHCGNGVPALRGKIHWDANDATVPAGPVTPVPASLWAPPAGSTPATGNYVYLEADAEDHSGQPTMTYTPSNASVTLRTDGAHLSVRVTSGSDVAPGEFQGMSVLTQLQTGYYPHLKGYPFHNPALGGLSWRLSCGGATGWFAVDAISYAGTAISSIDLRFEQHCEGRTAGLRGKVHWTP